MRNMEERRFNCAGINCAEGVEAVRIQTLIEDTSGSNTELVCEHGLSFYLETALHKVLFDLGASGGFLKNARALRIDLTQVDTVILSHGHNDHGGGLREFLSVNNKAKVYVRESAFEGHYSVSRELCTKSGWIRRCTRIRKLCVFPVICGLTRSFFYFPACRSAPFGHRPMPT